MNGRQGAVARDERADLQAAFERRVGERLEQLVGLGDSGRLDDDSLDRRLVAQFLDRHHERAAQRHRDNAPRHAAKLLGRLRSKFLQHRRQPVESAGIEVIGTDREVLTPGWSIHELGTARMGKDLKTSVLNAHNQVWDATNVFVTDGACMVSSACQNPSLTYMALTARAADYAVGELKKGNL